MQSDIYESHCSPISSDHRAKSLSELTSAEHIVTISLAWYVISVAEGAAVWGHMHEGGRCRHLSPCFCLSPRSFDGSLQSLVTPPGCKQLVTRASAMVVYMVGCTVYASSTGNSLCKLSVYLISFFYLIIIIFIRVCIYYLYAHTS